MQTYQISLENLFLDVIIGILPKERTQKQKIEINAYFSYIQESKEGFLDYRSLKSCIEEVLQRNFELLEEALSSLQEELIKNFPQLTFFLIKITKLEIFTDCKISMHIQYNKV
ncbi:MAG: dihydroneopterin aldolase [Helicobacter sp.]|nr:dihydroneopterin aldolase [Helicobacter sp.]